MDQTTLRLLQAYKALLAIPVTAIWRLKNQEIYATLRDDIASRTGVQPEFVQSTLEGVDILEKLTDIGNN